MYSKVRIKKSALDYFRRQARNAYPKEIQAYLLGVITSVNEVRVTDVVYPYWYDTQTSEEVGWTADEFKQLKERAIAEHKMVVGDIHSHPNYDPVMSGQDYRAAILDSLLVCGICSVRKNKTKVIFWTPTSSLPCEVTYL
jgi:proteasome lid subunit RPN8/RPN11